MAIKALPEATVRLLGSTQVLTTPTSLIKELVDNALDAKARFVDIVVSRNTLDRIEVRDNGHGIQQEDFDVLGRRGHTSKLRSFEELEFIGGITLGFRGEALSSALQLGDVTVTTKTEGKPVASKLVLKSTGGVELQTHISHPVGTTVCVSNFMAKLPVRKQAFEKEASKTLAKINQLLRSYALARPLVRFNLKIVNGSKGSWSFTPRPTDGVKEAVSQVIGRDAALECLEKSWEYAVVQPENNIGLS
jgi:DNA mismatch repair protein MutL